jgi:hypothetical protein
VDGQKNKDEWKAEQFPPSYEAPRIEAVLTPEELEREVLYAGGFSQIG